MQELSLYTLNKSVSEIQNLNAKIVSNINDYVNLGKNYIILWDSNTINSPYKKGVTNGQTGTVFVYSSNTTYSTLVAHPDGDSHIYIKTFEGGINKTVIEDWKEIEAGTLEGKTVEDILNEIIVTPSITSGGSSIGTIKIGDNSTITLRESGKIIPTKDATKTIYLTGTTASTTQTTTYVPYTDGIVNIKNGVLTANSFSGDGNNIENVTAKKTKANLTINVDGTSYEFNGENARSLTVTNTKNTAGATSDTAKIFLVGAKNQNAVEQTYSNTNVYMTNGTLYATAFSGNGENITSIKYSNIIGIPESVTNSGTSGTLTIKGINNIGTYDGSSNKEISITPANIGALALSGGTVTGKVTFENTVNITDSAEFYTTGTMYVADITASMGITAKGDITANDISAKGYFIGDGSKLTNIIVDKSNKLQIYGKIDNGKQDAIVGNITAYKTSPYIHLIPSITAAHDTPKLSVSVGHADNADTATTSIRLNVYGTSNASDAIVGDIIAWKTGNYVELKSSMDSETTNKVLVGYARKTVGTLTINVNGTSYEFDGSISTTVNITANSGSGGSSGSNYTLPKATSSTLGGVTIGDNISISDGKISLSSNNVTGALGYTPLSSSGSGANLTNVKAVSIIPKNSTSTIYLTGVNTPVSSASNTTSYTPYTDGKVKIYNGTLTANYFSGNGTNITNINPDNITNNPTKFKTFSFSTTNKGWYRLAKGKKCNNSDNTGACGIMTIMADVFNYHSSNVLSVSQNGGGANFAVLTYSSYNEFFKQFRMAKGTDGYMYLDGYTDIGNTSNITFTFTFFGIGWDACNSITLINSSDDVIQSGNSDGLNSGGTSSDKNESNNGGNTDNGGNAGGDTSDTRNYDDVQWTLYNCECNNGANHTTASDCMTGLHKDNYNRLGKNLFDSDFTLESDFVIKNGDKCYVFMSAEFSGTSASSSFSASIYAGDTFITSCGGDVSGSKLSQSANDTKTISGISGSPKLRLIVHMENPSDVDTKVDLDNLLIRINDHTVFDPDWL